MKTLKEASFLHGLQQVYGILKIMTPHPGRYSTSLAPHIMLGMEIMVLGTLIRVLGIMVT
ncbi:MAG: hypothetical protein ACFFFH_00285 [Candidatus Thorarchaeota archaeon]